MVKDKSVIEIMLQQLGMKNVGPVNIEAISATLQYCQQRIEVISELIVGQYPSFFAENLLSLLWDIHDVFDVISETTVILESSLNGLVGCVDLAVLDVQIALQVLVEAFISNCDVLAYRENRSDGAIVSSVYCVSSAMKTLVTTMSDLADKILISMEIVDGNAITGLQNIVQTVFNIVDRVMRSLKSINILDLNDVDPNLEQLSVVIQRIANQRLHFIPKLADTILSPISVIMDTLRSSMKYVPLSTNDSMESLIESLTTIQDIVPEKQIIPTVIMLLNTLQPDLASLSNAIHSIHGITDSVAYSTDVSLQNLMSIIKCLTYSITLLTNILPTIEPAAVGRHLQSILCFVVSNIQTLIDGITLAVDRVLVDLMCAPATIDKLVLDKQLTELQSLIEPVILTFENIVRTSIQIVQNLLRLGACTLGDTVADLIANMNQLINSLGRIVNELTVPIVSTKQLLSTVESTVVGDRLSEPETTLSINENVLSICITAFEGVAQNLVKLRNYVNESIKQIHRHIEEM